jgi:succinate dehydrogenase / fumarate reductase, cytochrome b subunit
MGNPTGEPKSSVVELLNLRWFLRLLSSSIGRKFVMGTTGLLLCGFLVAHLAGNLLLFFGQARFDHYAHGLHEQEWLPFAEAGLFVLFVAHIYLAFTNERKNQAARSVDYAVKQTKLPNRTLTIPPPSNWMFASGAVVLGFLILHLVDMRLALRPDIAHFDEMLAYRNTIEVLSNPYSRLLYIVGIVFLGFHLSHGFAAAFQSLGLFHPKYTPTIKILSKAFAVAIATGFILIVIFVPGLQEVREARKTPATVIEVEPKN